MIIMENYLPSNDRLTELWLQLERCHLSYLELEESPEKIDKKNKLEEIIYGFLCEAPHQLKFTYSETDLVLQRSAREKKDFSAYKASTGFAAIQLYAGNLLSQPWRKEYRTIKTYCGFYKHQIEANLVGAKIIFEAMGYKYNRGGIFILDGPICPDRVSAVSKDCMIAYVECQILKLIWEELSSSCLNPTWLEVLEYRRVHTCSPEQAVKGFKYRQHQPQQFHEHARYTQGANVTRHTMPAVLPNLSQVLPVNHSFPPFGTHLGLPDQMYSNGYCANRCPSCVPSYACIPPATTASYTMYGPQHRPPVAAPGFYYGSYAGPPPPIPGAASQYVSTGQLVEVGPQNGLYDIPDGPVTCCKPGKIDSTAYNVYRGKNNNGVRESDKNGSQLEDWEYVYRNLESQGYTKDLGERGDILSSTTPKPAKDSKKELDEPLNDRPLKITEALKRVERDKGKAIESKKVDRQISPDSSYDNIPASEHRKHNSRNSIYDSPGVTEAVKQTFKPSTSGYMKTRSLPREKTTQGDNSSKKVMDSIKKTDPPSNTNRWQCKSCTFLNDGSMPICEMCSRSRDAAVEQPMEIGGSECSQCTLVNSKHAKVCEACGASLENSPTYI